MDWPRCSEFLTASMAPMLARWVVAMAKIAPLSLAVATFMPVLTRFCVRSNWALVALRFCSAMAAP